MNINPSREMVVLSEAEPSWHSYILTSSVRIFTIKQVDILRKEMEAIDKQFNMTSDSLAVRIQDLPFNKDVQPLVIQDPLVQKFHKTMKQARS